MNEQNNNIDNNIINDENNIDNNVNNNMNNANNNQINFDVLQNLNYANKYKKITISFIIILLINVIIEIYSYFIKTNYRKYVFQYAPIFEKKQYYRFISSYFIHYGIWHILVELYLTFEICYLFENIMGTLITILYIMNTMIMNSVLHFLMIPVVSFFCKITRTSYDLNYDYESSLTSVLFSMTTFYYLFKDNKDKKIDVLYTFILSLKYLSILMFFVLYFLTPNKSFYSNLSGLINGCLFKYIPFIFLPRVTWVVDFEKFVGLKKFENIYRSITYKNGPMKNALNELQNNSVVDESLLKNINYGNDFNSIGRQMTELSNIQNNNVNNN